MIDNMTEPLSKEQARAIVEGRLRQLERSMRMPLAILDDKTIERPWGWVFFWNSIAYRDSRDTKRMVVGNAPFLINRMTGERGPTGTAHPVETYIRRYERQLFWRRLLGGWWRRE